MNVGTLLIVIALVLFAMWGMGVTLVPRVEAWGLFFFVLGLLLAPYAWPLR